MLKLVLPKEAESAVADIGTADIVIGIPSYNNARTIGQVVRAAQGGVAKYFPQLTAVIVNADGGSSDGTRETVLAARLEDANLLLLPTPLLPVHRLSLPYHGIPGKGSAFHLIFSLAHRLGARGCAVLDADLRSVTPEWIDLLLRPIVYAGYDFVAPYYHRHKYDGTITNSIVYPLTRALYGARVRQPIGGDFGVGARLLHRYLERNDWETDVARYGIDIWMTTIAIAEGYRVCQSFLGAKLHDAKDPAADLSAMLEQVVGSVFTLMTEYEHIWPQVGGSRPVDLFGFRFDVGLDPVEVNVARMADAFQRGRRDLGEIWAVALDADTLNAILRLDEPLHVRDELWFDVVAGFACACRDRPLERGHLLRALTPLYLARVASFVNETRDLFAAQVEDRIEALAACFEERKPYLASRWRGETPALPDRRPATEPQLAATRMEAPQ